MFEHDNSPSRQTANHKFETREDSPARKAHPSNYIISVDDNPMKCWALQDRPIGLEIWIYKQENSNFLYSLFTMDAGTPPWMSSRGGKRGRKGGNSRVIRGRTDRERSLPPFALPLSTIENRSMGERGPIVSYLPNEKCIRAWLNVDSFARILVDIGEIGGVWWFEIRNSVFCQVGCFIVEKCGTSEYMENICKIEKINTFPRVSINCFIFRTCDKWTVDIL